uniref:ANF_receptor domain-containing protein n=1 Tax=Heterorhabditis bacteriophora TaxID=37862 RepID=A0A1I7XTK7_HETBA
MANFWNLPIISYMATSNVLSDKKVYKTLVRTSLRTMNTIAESTAAFITHYKWKKVSIISNIGSTAYEKISAFEPVLRNKEIQVVKKILFEETATTNDMLNSGQMDEIRFSSRVVIVIFSSTRDLTSTFRQAAEKAGLSTTEFIFIFPWLQEGANGASPFIDDTNGFDDRVITPFVERLKSIGLEEKDIDLSNIYGYIALFDALKMFATAGRRVINTTGDFSSATDGKMMWNAMRRMTIPGKKD